MWQPSIALSGIMIICDSDTMSCCVGHRRLCSIVACGRSLTCHGRSYCPETNYTGYDIIGIAPGYVRLWYNYHRSDAVFSLVVKGTWLLI